MTAIAVIAAILVGIGLLQAAVWIPLFGSWRRKSDAFLSDLRAEMTAAGERFVIEPERAVYRGCTGPYGKVRGNGTMLLTDRRVIFRKLTGGPVEVPVVRITEVGEAASFLASRVAGQTHLVISTSDPAQLGFFVTDLDAWRRALESVRST